MGDDDLYSVATSYYYCPPPPPPTSPPPRTPVAFRFTRYSSAVVTLQSLGLVFLSMSLVNFSDCLPLPSNIRVRMRWSAATSFLPSSPALQPTYVCTCVHSQQSQCLSANCLYMSCLPFVFHNHYSLLQPQLRCQHAHKHSFSIDVVAFNSVSHNYRSTDMYCSRLHDALVCFSVSLEYTQVQNTPLHLSALMRSV